MTSLETLEIVVGPDDRLEAVLDQATRALLRQRLSRFATRSDLAESLGVSYDRLSSLGKRHGVALPDGRKAPTRRRSTERRATVFGGDLKAERNARGSSAPALAERLGISATRVYQIEASDVTPEVAARYRTALARTPVGRRGPGRERKRKGPEFSRRRRPGDFTPYEAKPKAKRGPAPLLPARTLSLWECRPLSARLTEEACRANRSQARTLDEASAMSSTIEACRRCPGVRALALRGDGPSRPNEIDVAAMAADRMEES